MDNHEIGRTPRPRTKLGPAESGGKALRTGTWLQSGSIEAAEIVGAVGYDFAIIDLEHSSYGWERAADLLRVVQRFKTQAILRLLSHSDSDIFKALDMGADGILVPRLRTVREAHRVVEACLAPPRGIRGGCPTTRESLYGLRNREEVTQAPREIWVLIETPEVVASVHEFLESGITGVVLGPFDLSIEMGLNGDTEHLSVRQAMESVAVAARDHGIPCVFSLGATRGASLTKEIAKWEEVVPTAVTVPSDRALLTSLYGELHRAAKA